MGRLGLADDPNHMDAMWHTSLEIPEKVK